MSDRTGNADLLRAAMDAQGITDPEMRAGIAAIVGGETGWVPRTEDSYVHTDNDRIRDIFKTALGNKTDDFIDSLKADTERFFNYVYGSQGAGSQLGNEWLGDGFKFRGRGGVQLTGRRNYTELATLTGLDLVNTPSMVNVPANSAIIAVAYMRWRYRGGGWAGIKQAVGNSFGNVDAEKNRLYRQYLASGEFAHRAAPPTPVALPPFPPSAPQRNPAVVIAILKALQTALIPYGYDRAIDGDFGDRSQGALVRFREQA